MAELNEIHPNLGEDWHLTKADVKLHTKIQEGDTSVLWRGQARGAPCALKVLPSMESEEKQAALMNEISCMLTAGQHPNVIAFIGARVEDMKEPIYALEFMSGLTLEDFLLQDNPCCPYNPPHNTIYWWMHQLFDGLAYLHSLKPMIIHRDLEPDSILISADYNILKIGNFGASRRLDDFSSLIEDGLKGVRKKGYSMYFAPELREKKAPYNEKVDIFSAGLVCWRIATHEVIRDRDQWTNADWRPDLELVEWPSIENIIEQCWVTDPASRPSAAAVLKKLELIEDKPYASNAAPLKAPGVVSCTCGPGKKKSRKVCKVCFAADALCNCTIM
mmetsp:Transcript_52851/g.129049  ORF Transcript_52851/g.129049 Transcript_52851/m.129049 type:complete len:332 (+) Transcript_52851:172-1167(+)